MGNFDCFARYYDLDHENFRRDIDLYRNLARRSGAPILEIGCGTGRVLIPLAEAGYEVTGIDLSPAILAIAAERVAKSGVAPRVHLVQADARDFHLPDRFALAFVAVNTFMLFVGLDEQLQVLERVAAHLRPGGLFVLDLFNPDLSQLAEARGVLVYDYAKIDLASGHTVSKCHAGQVDVANQRLDVTFIYDELGDDGAIRRTVAPFSIHYFWRRELELLLDKTGYQVEEVYGSYELDEYTPESERMIAVARKRKRG